MTEKVRDGDAITVWFSCGAASAVAARLTLDRYHNTNPVRIVNNPVQEEHADNRRFLLDVQAWLGVPIEIATNPEWPSHSCVDVWEKRRYMSGVAGAPCTMVLKKRARQHWESSNPHDWLVLGFTAEERRRAEMFALTERDTLIPVLVDAGVTKAECFRILMAAGLRLPEVYRLGYPNANCIGCVKASSPTYWNHVRTMHPEVFHARAKQSRELGARLVRVQGERIFLDQLDPDARGRPMKTMTIDCGIFCEEPST